MTERGVGPETEGGPPEEAPKRGPIRLSGQTVAIIVLLAVLVYLIVAPMGAAVWGAFRDGPPGTAASYTTAKFTQAVSSPVFLKTTLNTLTLGLTSSAISLSIATYLAWLTERTNVPFRSAIYALVMVPLIVPGILMAIAWELTLNPTIGIANEAIATLLGGEGTVFNSHTLTGMIWAMAASSITLPFLLMAAAFRTMDPALEEASQVSGASYFHTIRRVTLPVLLPSILAAFLLVFIRAIEDFNVPAAMGVPGGIPVFATEVWLAAQRFPVDFNLASAFGVIYLLVAMLGVMAYYRATRMAERFVTITGKAFRPTRRDLGARRWGHLGAASLILMIAVGLPFAVMLYTSLLGFYQVPSARAFSSMSLKNFAWVFTSGQGLGALRNNLVLGIPTGLVAMLIATLIAWLTLRTRVRGRKLLDAIAFSPIAIPGIVMGLAFLWLYLSFPVLPIFGTLWIIGLAFVAKYMAYGVRASHASLSQLDPELEEAAAVCGATWNRTLRQVVFPLMTSGLLVGFIYIVSLTFKVLALPVLLSGPRTKVLATLVLDLYQNGEFTRVNAVGVIMFVALLALFAVSRLISRKIGYVGEPGT